VKRLPVRLRLTLAFAALLAVVLVVAGLFLYSQQKSRLNQSIDQDLNSRESATAALVDRDGRLGVAGRRAVAAPGEGAAQVLAGGGRVLDGTRGLRRRPLLDSAELRAALAGRTHHERDVVPGIEGPARLLATSESVGDGRRVVIVAAKGVDDRDEALSSLTHLLWILGPATLLLASLAGYWVIALALRPVEEARRRERRFVQDASHELRTPLSILKGELELALRRDRQPDELRATLARAAEETDRLVRLAEDLLVLSRTNRGRLEVHREDTGIRPLVDEACERHRSSAEAAGVGIQVEAMDGRAAVDPLRVRQALDNLLDNAILHSPRGSVVKIGIARRDGELCLVVEDSGPGFPPDLLARAFEPFARGPDPDRNGSGGAGLGLAIVQAIAQGHGGTAFAENRTEGGSRVTVLLRES
jgi:two-component system, OmpR family, sensor kinase